MPLVGQGLFRKTIDLHMEYLSRSSPMSFPSLMCDYPWLEIRPLRVFLKFSLADFYRRIHKYSFVVCRFLSWLIISLKWRICSFPFNAWCRYNLMISLRSSLPLLNGIIFPPAPEFVQNRIFPFIAFCVEPYLNRFRSLITPHTSQTDCNVFLDIPGRFSPIPWASSTSPSFPLFSASSSSWPRPRPSAWS